MIRPYFYIDGEGDYGIEIWNGNKKLSLYMHCDKSEAYCFKVKDRDVSDPISVKFPSDFDALWQWLVE